eukprot:Plantae.Rhodophyta-Purpureofilum_apyrenoidigerum.ctg6465.p1 GENE.Plantae.Rhodophyta-Purpureofilum_apyrenoidigerum.ctg6465~~Plantae.Rhodophyta-Purpureofilum_apyrenoidigerum.ctg6465.p1  ORF type:complete len:327 (-),score=52.84 Plantae.Rhodophyta-Purpureofilum_apyrenoidigerum.ctg6465:320-1210(-)
MMASKKVLFVLGSTGSIGSATVRALAEAHDATTTEIRAGCRDPDKAVSLKELPGVQVVRAEMGSDDLETALGGVDSLYIVSPGAINRAELSLKAMEAAKKAGVKHILQLSVATAGSDSIFGRQFDFVERGVKAIGMNYTIMRLPLFTDNYWAFKESIVGEGNIYSPVDPSMAYSPVLTEDAGKAAATIMLNYESHLGKTYTICGDSHTFSDVADAFSKSLGKEVNYVRVPYPAAKQAFMGMGMPEWQTDGTMELYNYIDQGSPLINYGSSDYQSLVGSSPTSISDWTASIAPNFTA